MNIANSIPTVCLNDIISEYNKGHGTALPPMSIEQFLARYCSQLERVLDQLSSDAHLDDFFDEYYQYWLHTLVHFYLKLSVSGVYTWVYIYTVFIYISLFLQKILIIALPLQKLFQNQRINKIIFFWLSFTNSKISIECWEPVSTARLSVLTISGAIVT